MLVSSPLISISKYCLPPFFNWLLIKAENMHLHPSVQFQCVSKKFFPWLRESKIWRLLFMEVPSYTLHLLTVWIHSRQWFLSGQGSGLLIRSLCWPLNPVFSSLTLCLVPNILTGVLFWSFLINTNEVFTEGTEYYILHIFVFSLLFLYLCPVHSFNLLHFMWP